MKVEHDWRQVGDQYGSGFVELLEAGRHFWRVRGIQRSAPSTNYIVVELMTQDIRVNLRNLSLAASLSLETGARIIAVIGCDPTWRSVVWGGYDPAKLTLLARAWGAVDVVDVAALSSELIRSGSMNIDHLVCRPVKKRLLKRKRFDEILDSTFARVLQVPAVGSQERATPEALSTRAFAEWSEKFWESILTTLRPLAFVTSHVDYAQWAIPVTIAGILDIPSLHVQSTGGLKAYYGLPRNGQRKNSYRRSMTRALGTYFEREIWAHRNEFAQPAEVVTWRARQNLGVPAWWRRDGEHDRVLMTTQAERHSIRRWAGERRGLNLGKPTVAVFNHAVSDALDGNHEAFDSLYDWFSQTANYAAQHPEVNWLFLDHPRQSYYDVTDSFGTLAKRFSGLKHMHFMPSSDLSKNELWALTDLAITTRGSVSNEFPAFGIPAVQAGWSEWSHCGFTLRADTQRQYWRTLKSCIASLVAGESPITSEQVLRARLWMWFYRSATDLNSALVPHWHLDNQDRFRTTLTFALTQPESDADPLFHRVARWWHNPTPALLRAERRELTGGYRPWPVRITEPLQTTVDEPREEMVVNELLTSGTGDRRLRLISGWTAGTAVIGRINGDTAVLGLPIAPTAAPTHLELTMATDDNTQKWLKDRFSVGPDYQERSMVVHLNGDVEAVRARCTFEAREGEKLVRTCRIPVDPADILANGLLIVSLSVAADSPVAHGLCGLELKTLTLTDRHEPVPSPVTASPSWTGRPADGRHRTDLSSEEVGDDEVSTP